MRDRVLEEQKSQIKFVGDLFEGVTPGISAPDDTKPAELVGYDREMNRW